MNKLFTLIFLSLPLLAADWQWLNPVPHGNGLNDVYTIDDNKAVAVGALGTIMRTEDGGGNWETIFQVNGLYGDLYAVQFVSDQVGFAVGEWGTILQTKDGGASWEFKKSGTTQNLYTLCFITADSGWVAGRWGNLYQTTDGGETWSEQTSETFRRLLSISFADGRHGVAVGHGGTIIKTDDGGVSWSEKESGVENHLRHVCFVNDSLCWAVGDDGAMIKSSDGGENWLSVADSSTYDIASISFADADTGWAVGFQGYEGDLGELYKTTGAILKTVDGGVTWVETVKDSIFALNALSVKNGRGWAAGEAGTIIRLQKSDSGLPSNPLLDLADIISASFIDPQVGFGAGGNTVVKTTDGGASWQAHELDITQGLQSIKFVNPQKGYASGFYLYQTPTSIVLNAVIMGSNDGGETWQQQYYKDYDLLLGVETVNDSVAYAVGTRLDMSSGNIRGLILKTRDGGQTWQSVSFKYTGIYYNSRFIDENTGWIVGESAIIYYTKDGGVNWERQRPGLNVGLYVNIDFVDPLHGWACGANGTVVATSDGGQTWTQQNTNVYGLLYDIDFIDQRTGYAVGEGGTVISTVDGGATWTAERTMTDVFFYDVCFPSVSTGYVFGERGVILKTTNGVSAVNGPGTKKQTPVAFELQQNYPNPFNAQTTIRFSLPNASRVTLRVYNLLGEEVATLIDQPLAAGEHAVDFDASSLASGLYFYQLQSGDDMLIKKMIVQK